MNNNFPSMLGNSPRSTYWNYIIRDSKALWGQNYKFFTTPLSRNSQKRLGFRRANKRGGLGRVLIIGLKKVFQYGNLQVKIRPPEQANTTSKSGSHYDVSWSGCIVRGSVSYKLM